MLVVILTSGELSVLLFYLENKLDACVYEGLSSQGVGKKLYGNIDFLENVKVGTPSYDRSLLLAAGSKIAYTRSQRWKVCAIRSFPFSVTKRS